MTVQVTLQLPEALVEEAQAAGILNSDRIAALLQMELRREVVWERLHANAQQLQAAAEDLASLSEEQVMQLVNDEIHRMRAEQSGGGASDPV